MKQKKLTEKQLRVMIRETIQATLKEQKPAVSQEQFIDARLAATKLYQQLDEMAQSLYRQGVADKGVREAAYKIKGLRKKCHQIYEELDETREELGIK